MAFTFLAAKGYDIGKSLVDSEKIDYCKEMMAKAEAKGVKLLLPVDAVVADSFPNPIDGEIAVETVAADAIPADKMGLDVGEKSQAIFAEAAKTAKTVVWNGPMGVFENPTLAKGTIAVAQALADSDAVTIVGGGDSAAACEQLGFADKITHISTGGGASLEFLEGLELPGIACLTSDVGRMRPTNRLRLCGDLPGPCGRLSNRTYTKYASLKVFAWNRNLSPTVLAGSLAAYALADTSNKLSSACLAYPPG